LDDTQLKQPQINHPVESSWDQLVRWLNRLAG